jgi:hypothetical protein
MGCFVVGTFCSLEYLWLGRFVVRMFCRGDNLYFASSEAWDVLYEDIL